MLIVFNIYEKRTDILQTFRKKDTKLFNVTKKTFEPQFVNRLDLFK